MSAANGTDTKIRAETEPTPADVVKTKLKAFLKKPSNTNLEEVTSEMIGYQTAFRAAQIAKLDQELA